MNLKNKRILITAGPTWVAIDKVRVISNVATGETGILLAEKLSRAGAQVTLILGPVASCCLDKKNRILNFKFFEELQDKLAKELSTGRYDVLIHSAAVSDYRPRKTVKGKIKSDLKDWDLKLVRTPKLIDRVKKIAPSIFLVAFKFEPDTDKERLLASAKKLGRHAKADLIIANTQKGNNYQAYMISRDKISGVIRNKANLAKNLIKHLEKI
jgi:phosphopantothenoylcysteine synthetase/decarboxylase